MSLSGESDGLRAIGVYCAMLVFALASLVLTQPEPSVLEAPVSPTCEILVNGQRGVHSVGIASSPHSAAIDGADSDVDVHWDLTGPGRILEGQGTSQIAFCALGVGELQISATGSADGEQACAANTMLRAVECLTSDTEECSSSTAAELVLRLISVDYVALEARACVDIFLSSGVGGDRLRSVLCVESR